MRDDFDPARARTGFLREGGSLLTHAVLYGFGYLPSRHQSKRERDIRTIVFVHGLAANRSCFYPMQSYLWARGHRRHYAYNYSTHTGSIEGMALDLKRRLDRDIKGGRIDIVGHSLGGVVARTYLQMLGGDRRVDRLVTIGSPHAGTHASVYVPSALVRQLQPGSSFLTELDRLPRPSTHVVSIAAGQDIIVVPPESALLPWGEQHMLSDAGHTSVMLTPTVFRTVYEALSLEVLPADQAVLPTTPRGAP